jgi:hypothetical protein
MFTSEKPVIVSDLVENRITIKINKNIFKAQPIVATMATQEQHINPSDICDKQAAALFEIY